MRDKISLLSSFRLLSNGAAFGRNRNFQGRSLCAPPGQNMSSGAIVEAHAIGFAVCFSGLGRVFLGVLGGRMSLVKRVIGV